MFYFVEVEFDKIVGKREDEIIIELPFSYKQITKELYDSIGAIPCSFVEDNEEIINIEFIDPSPVITLQEIQENKILELNTLCNQEILGGFTSSATGTEHQYKFDMEYQGNFSQQGVMLLMDSTMDTVMWPTSDAGVIPHTREQFIQLCKDAQTWKATNTYRYFTLKAQIQATETIDLVNAFTW